MPGDWDVEEATAERGGKRQLATGIRAKFRNKQPRTQTDGSAKKRIFGFLSSWVSGDSKATK